MRTFPALTPLPVLALLVPTLSGCGTGGTDRTPGTADMDDVRTVLARVETRPVESDEDAADDPAIWINASDPTRSLVLGTDKKMGLAVYDLSGALLQLDPVGRVNNVDVRSGLRLGGQTLDVAGASHRDLRGISLWRIDPSGRIEQLPGSPIATPNLDEPYGFCLARAKSDGRLYAFITDKHGLVEHWLIEDNGHGQLTGTLLRQLRVSSQPEGLVVDEAHGWLFVGEESTGVWRFPLDPQDRTPGVLITSTRTHPRTPGPITADVEGLAIVDAEGPGNRGWLVISSQGNNQYVVLDRRPPHTLLGTFRIGESPAIDGVQETDGLDATSTPLGPTFPGGLLVVQDGENPGQRQNFKFVGWEDVTRGLRPLP